MLKKYSDFLCYWPQKNELHVLRQILKKDNCRDNSYLFNSELLLTFRQFYHIITVVSDLNFNGIIMVFSLMCILLIY